VKIQKGAFPLSLPLSCSFPFSFCLSFSFRSRSRSQKNPFRDRNGLSISSVLACLLEIMRKIRCRGRTRTSTGQLAKAQSFSGQPWSALPMVTSALCYVCPVIPTPETRGHVCQDSITPQYLRTDNTTILQLFGNSLNNFQQKF